MREGARQDDAEDEGEGQAAEGRIQQAGVGAQEIAFFQAAERRCVADNERRADGEVVHNDRGSLSHDRIRNEEHRSDRSLQG